ncbi:MAG TPA: hypothetical protein VNZ06_04900 [Steroidobacteraceae bacterium]|jgi:hypothetical protein|nr:hypothetical protein [Steroidobacteraceae bacterium]
MRRSIRTLITTAILISLSACVSTSIVEHWRDPGFAGPALHKVLVVSVQRDQGRRRLWEEAMVAALAKHAVQAEASYQVFPDQAPSPEKLTAMATRDAFDGVVATHFVRAGQHVTAYGGWGPWDCCWRPWGWGAWGPGYVESDTLTDYQTDVYTIDASGGKLIWTAVTRSVDPSSAKSVTEGISRALVPQLTKEGILTGTHS